MNKLYVLACLVLAGCSASNNNLGPLFNISEENKRRYEMMNLALNEQDIDNANTMIDHILVFLSQMSNNDILEESERQQAIVQSDNALRIRRYLNLIEATYLSTEYNTDE